jgi:hypothetical protein
MLGFAVQLDTSTTYYIESTAGLREAVPLPSLCLDLSVDDVTPEQAASGSFEYVVAFLCGADAPTSVRLLRVSLKDGISHAETVHADDARIGHADKLRVRKSLQAELYLLAAYEKLTRSLRVFRWTPDEDADLGQLVLLASVPQGSLDSASGRPVLLRTHRPLLPAGHRRPGLEPAAVQHLQPAVRRAGLLGPHGALPPAAGRAHHGLHMSADGAGLARLRLPARGGQHHPLALLHLG